MRSPPQPELTLCPGVGVGELAGAMRDLEDDPFCACSIRRFLMLRRCSSASASLFGRFTEILDPVLEVDETERDWRGEEDMNDDDERLVPEDPMRRLFSSIDIA